MKNVRIALVRRQPLCWFRTTIFLVLFLSLTGCETLSFYRQLASGQIDILRNRQSVETLLQDASLDARLRDQLLKIKDIRAFAASELGIGSEGGFTTYVDLDRDYVVWNVYLAEIYEVHSINNCYPLVGCVPYRGYFSKTNAHDYAKKMSEQEGLEAYIGGVPAYSTLGWFKDPILSTFIDWEDQELASLIIHELLHQRIWLRGDAQFNEGLASFVGNRAATSWSAQNGREQENERFIETQRQWQLFRQFVSLAGEYLHTRYAASKDFNELKVIKTKAMEEVRGCYRDLSFEVFDGRYDSFVYGERFNNAFIASIGVYESDHLAYKRLLDLSNHDWTVFFKEIESLMSLDKDTRHAKLESLSNDEITDQANDENASQIHCEAF